MAVKIPEFILSRMFVRGSLRKTERGFVFSLKNTYAPATIHGFRLEVAGSEVPQSSLALRLESVDERQPADTIGFGAPFPLPVNTLLEVMVSGADPGDGRLRIHVDTREVGTLSFSVKTEPDVGDGPRRPRRAPLRRLLSRPLKTRAEVLGERVIGQVRPEVYGHFVEHLERSVYGGIWDNTGELNQDVVDLVREMGPTVIRYPGGNFASDYHWEEGLVHAPVGPRTTTARGTWKIPIRWVRMSSLSSACWSALNHVSW